LRTSEKPSASLQIKLRPVCAVSASGFGCFPNFRSHQTRSPITFADSRVRLVRSESSDKIVPDSDTKTKTKRFLKESCSNLTRLSKSTFVSDAIQIRTDLLSSHTPKSSGLSTCISAAQGVTAPIQFCSPGSALTGVYGARLRDAQENQLPLKT
jgi:hypothetical protein